MQGGQVHGVPPALPMELWERVAEMVPTRDWARATSACRDLCQITPTKLVLVEEHDYEEALQWTVGRWAAIKQLAYVQTHTAVNEPADVAFAHGDVIIPVHQLQVAVGNENLHWSDWIPALLSRVPVLWSLKINIQRCPALPLLPQLQHLWLDVEQDSPGLVPSLLQLETLQSLWLGRQRFQAAQAAEQAHVAVALVAPGAAAAPMAAVAAEDALILSPSVQHIVLKDALPAVLMLSNPACTISLVSGVDDIATALHAWAEAGGHDAAQIKSIEVVAADEALELMDLEQALHPLLHNLPHLLYMKIQTPSPPPPPNQPPNYDGLYLHNSLRYAPLDNLTSLIVQSGRRLCITIPSRPSLRRVFLNCEEGACVTFQDAHASAQTLLAFDLYYADGQLCRVWEFLEFNDHVVQAGDVLLREQLDNTTLMRIRKLGLCMQPGWANFCHCGCCLQCMQKGPLCDLCGGARSCLACISAALEEAKPSDVVDVRWIEKEWDETEIGLPHNHCSALEEAIVEDDLA